jgi:hypothetical protein
MEKMVEKKDNNKRRKKENVITGRKRNVFCCTEFKSVPYLFINLRSLRTLLVAQTNGQTVGYVCEEAVVVYFEVGSLYLAGGTGEQHEEPQSR